MATAIGPAIRYADELIGEADIGIGTSGASSKFKFVRVGSELLMQAAGQGGTVYGYPYRADGLLKVQSIYSATPSEQCSASRNGVVLQRTGSGLPVYNGTLNIGKFQNEDCIFRLDNGAPDFLITCVGNALFAWGIVNVIGSPPISPSLYGRWIIYQIGPGDAAARVQSIFVSSVEYPYSPIGDTFTLAYAKDYGGGDMSWIFASSVYSLSSWL